MPGSCASARKDRRLVETLACRSLDVKGNVGVQSGTDSIALTEAACGPEDLVSPLRCHYT